MFFYFKYINEVLWNGIYGGELVKIFIGNDENIYVFICEKNCDWVLVIINLLFEV